jgi:hypothetical protein
MNARVHFWIVCDAVSFIREHGDDLQKETLQAFQLAFGDNENVDELPSGRTAVEYLAGFESWHTDKFGDLSLRIRGLPWGEKQDLTGLAGHMFTAFNHFINPYPDTENEWPDANGYSYRSSSMKGFDSTVVGGISEYLRGLVDVDNSLVLERIRPFWRKNDTEWEKNFRRELRQTTFAPWNVLVRVYYSRLLSKTYEPLEVRGPNRYIVGLQLLGPVLHAITDSCSVQHIRTTLGLGHQVWENYIQSRVYDRVLDFEPDLVRRILTEEPCEPRLTATDGPVANMFDVSAFVHRFSVRTAQRLQTSWEVRSWADIRRAGEDFWKRYLTGTTMIEDAEYLYNQAVAGTVHAIVRAHADLVTAGVMTPAGDLVHKEKLPRLELVQASLQALPMKRSGVDDVPAEKTRPVPLSDPRDLLGFDVDGAPELQEMLDEADSLFSGSTSDTLDLPSMTALMTRVEELLIEQYEKMKARMGPAFCPARTVERIPLDSDISAHFGMATFRLPSAKECEDPERLENYIGLVENHALKANKFQLTQALATLKFYRAGLGTRKIGLARLDEMIAKMERQRDGAEILVPEGVSHTYLQFDGLEEPETESWKSGRSEPSKFLSTIRKGLSQLLEVPILAYATVAAVVLVFVVLYPRGVTEPILGLSSARWGKPRLMGVEPVKPLPKKRLQYTLAKPKVAVILYFKDFRPPPTRELVNSLYRAIEPNQQIGRTLDFVSPDELKEAIDGGEIRSDTKKELMDGLREKMGMSDVLVLTVASKGDRFLLYGELRDLKNGKSAEFKEEKELTRRELSSVLKKSVENQLRNVRPR